MGQRVFQQMHDAFDRSTVLAGTSGTAGDAADNARLAAIARDEYASRRQRDTLFPAGIFAEPAWDMLLDLYVQQHQKRPVSIHSLCIAAAVPPTTALRWIGRLVDVGLMRREPSLQDNRVIYVSLTDEGQSVLGRYLRGRM